MSGQNSTGGDNLRFKELADGYQPKLPPKLALMIPLKKEIQGLRARKAAYDVIRLLLQDAKIFVSLDTVYRFCRDVLGEKTARPYKPRSPKYSAVKISPLQPSIQAALQEQREQIPGPWSRRKPGPRIANSKNL